MDEKAPDLIQGDLTQGDHEIQFLIDSLPSLIAYVGTDCRYRRINRTFCEWLARPASAIHGRTLQEVLGDQYMTVVAPYVAHVLRGQVARFQVDTAYPQGPRTVNVVYTPDLDAHGQVRGFCIQASDVTEQVRHEREIQRHAALLDQAMEPLFIWELDGVIKYWNRGAADLYGYSQADALGRSSHQLLKTIHPLPLPEFIDELAQNGSWSGELVHTTRDGRQITVASYHQLVVDEGQALVLESNRDISERMELETTLRRLNETLETRVQERTEQLSAANSELEAFSYSVSHDLRAPLRTVDGFGRILLRDYRGRTLDERGVHLVERMSAATLRMERLIDNLLQLSHVSRSPLKRVSVDLSVIAAEVWDELQSRDPSRSVRIAIKSGLHVCGDAGLIRIVVENLLSNAWKFTGKTIDASVQLGCEVIDAQPTFFVADNGAGFDSAHADQLFIPFQRLHSHGDFEGSGIGLALVQRIIRRHGGSLRAESSVGHGARFFFTLPGDECR